LEKFVKGEKGGEGKSSKIPEGKERVGQNRFSPQRKKKKDRES